MAKPGEIIKIVNPTTIPYTDGRPDYKKEDYLEVIKPEKRDNFAEGACRYSSSDYSKDLREKIDALSASIAEILRKIQAVETTLS